MSQIRAELPVELKFMDPVAAQRNHDQWFESEKWKSVFDLMKFNRVSKTVKNIPQQI